MSVTDEELRAWRRRFGTHLGEPEPCVIVQRLISEVERLKLNNQASTLTMGVIGRDITETAEARVKELEAALRTALHWWEWHSSWEGDPSDPDGVSYEGETDAWRGVKAVLDAHELPPNKEST